MSKNTKLFDVAIMDYSGGTITIMSRLLPEDIQTEELAEILSAEGVYKDSSCYLMFTESTIDVVDIRGN